ncbi:hypothetical protein [Sedimenticola selenatireducens]|uniref:hypothetical protein n=1 Tax=Sedimenticola selenatireducens TaxID=191960 RepID=UPI0030806D0F
MIPGGYAQLVALFADLGGMAEVEWKITANDLDGGLGNRRIIQPADSFQLVETGGLNTQPGHRLTNLEADHPQADDRQ